MADIKDYLESFLSYLRIEKASSNNTIRDYSMEIMRLSNYLALQKMSDINLISTRILRQYFNHSKEKRNLAPSSVSKIIAVIKSFFNYLEEDEIILRNPSRKLKVPKKIYKIPRVMSKHEVDLIHWLSLFCTTEIPKECSKRQIDFISSLLYGN